MNGTLTDKVKAYWDSHLHDAAIVRHPVGTREFFADLDEYHFDKQRHLARVLDFRAYAGKKVLDLGCGVGVDFAHFAKAGAQVTGVDISDQAISLARQNLQLQGLAGELLVMDGECMEFADNTFDFVYAHGVLPYTRDDAQLVSEIHRVLKPGGEALLQVYHKFSWMYLLRFVFKTRMEHEHAPVFRVHTAREIKAVASPFKKVQVIYDRFPVATRLHGGLKGVLYNKLFVGSFNAIPRPLVRRFGWHIIVKATK